MSQLVEAKCVLVYKVHPSLSPFATFLCAFSIRGSIACGIPQILSILLWGQLVESTDGFQRFYTSTVDTKRSSPSALASPYFTTLLQSIMADLGGIVEQLWVLLFLSQSMSAHCLFESAVEPAKATIRGTGTKGIRFGGTA